MKPSIFYRRKRILWTAAALAVVAISGYTINAVETGAATDADFMEYVRKQLPGKAEAMIPALRAAFPDYSPSHLITVLETLKGYWIATVLQAERKAAQGAAPVYVYLLAWETPVDGGRFRAHHALDLPLVFNNVETSRSMVGPDPEPQRVADQMSSAWIAFARSGNPNAEGLPQWRAYDLKSRATMIFSLDSHVQNDPFSEIRRFCSLLPTNKMSGDEFRIFLLVGVFEWSVP